ncbi:MAG: hypothetical protein ACK5TH_04125 [Prosthecobacter sp.]|jgi:hypothetical protein
MAKPAKTIAVIGAALQLAWVVGLLLTLGQLNRATAEFDLSQATNNNEVAAMLSRATATMGSAFDASLLGLGVSILGVGIFGYALTRLRFRERWAFWFATIHGSLLVCLFPLGTPFGLFLLIQALSHRTEFGQSISQPATS